MKTLNLVLGLLIFSSLSYAGNEGGGGGGICTPKRCMTLAQAGLRIDEKKTNDFELEQVVVDEVVKIVGGMPFLFQKESFYRSVIGGTKTFIIASQENVKSFQNFKSEYLDILNSSGTDTKSFQLLAVSKDSITYLLPGFDLLDTRGKALILVHESLIRDFRANVIQALTFDGYFFDYLAAIQKNAFNSFDSWPMLKLMSDLSIVRDLEKNLFVDALRRNNGLITIKELCDTETRYTDRNCFIPREKALALRRIHPDFAKRLSSYQFDFDKVRFDDLKEFSLDPKLVDNFLSMCKKTPAISGNVLTASPGGSFYKLYCTN
jgi:hypothetical protein